jgi:dipeptidyl aminopeptidase/acylaminoacyl peptidase
MNLDDRLDHARGELADEVATDVRVPSFDGVLARRAHRRRLQAAAGGAALVVVAAGVVGGVAATRPAAHRSVPPAATVSVSPPPTSPPVSTSPTTMPGSAQTYPARGESYVVVADGDQLAWTDLKSGAHGHFGPADGSTVLSPSVSTDGRRVVFVDRTSEGNRLGTWDLDTGSGGSTLTGHDVLMPSISPDGKTVAWYVQATGIVTAPFDDLGGANTAAIPRVDQAAWSGNGALAYLPDDRNTGGQCTVERLDLATRSTRCLLPTATLQSVFASDGSTWQVDSVSGAPDTGTLALGVTTSPGGSGAVHGAIGLLDSGAEATPFHVLPSSVVDDTSTESVFFPVLLDRGTRVVYVDAKGTHDKPGQGTVVSLEIASGATTAITTGGALGMSATNG